MSYNGSGTFQINSTGQPVVTGTVISSTAFNALTADLATGLSTAITKDGQTTPTANIKLGGFKLTNVGTATTAGDALIFGSGTNSSTLAVHTRQIFLTGTAATYTTPANVRQIVVRIKGGGGGGSSSAGSVGGVGGTTTFNSINALGGAAGPSGAVGGAGGTGGTGTASVRFAGAPGVASSSAIIAASSYVTTGGNGGGVGGGVPTSSVVSAGGAGVTNSGGGGCGGGQGATSFAVAQTSCGGGGEGEYAEIIINSPSATYTYTVGAGGTAGTAAGTAGGAGGSGIVIVDEYY